jgi:hypothetical protein
MEWWMTASSVHGAVTWFLTGLIWIVQRVHYPSMHYVDESRFTAFEEMHCRRIGHVVAPSMLLEGALAAALVLLAPTALDRWLAVVGAGLAALIWWSTFFIQVPLHDRLQQGKNTDTINRLIATNWIRTVAWSLRGGIALAMLLHA